MLILGNELKSDGRSKGSALVAPGSEAAAALHPRKTLEDAGARMTHLTRRRKRTDSASIASSIMYEADVGAETKPPHHTAPLADPPPGTLY